MTILIIVVSLTILISAACSLFEAVLLSTRMGTLEAEKGEKSNLAKHFIEMKENISIPIAGILILNTIANTAGATVSGMFAANALGAGNVPLFSVCFTLSILFFSEITPKTIGAVHWRNLWHLIVWPLIIIRYLLSPAIYVTQKISNRLTRGQKTFAITEDEILAMVRLGAKAGELSAEEGLMVRNIINLENRRARDVLTPRTVMIALDENMPLKEAADLVDGHEFSRYPVFKENLDHITGYVMLRDIISRNSLNRPNKTLKDIVKPVHFVPDSINCLSLLNEFLRARLHISIVSDEYGGVAGLITLEDLIETALGTNIVDETDRNVNMQQKARRSRSATKPSRDNADSANS